MQKRCQGSRTWFENVRRPSPDAFQAATVPGSVRVPGFMYDLTYSRQRICIALTACVNIWYMTNELNIASDSCKAFFRPERKLGGQPITDLHDLHDPQDLPVADVEIVFPFGEHRWRYET